ncbi:MAG: helix-turn-helix domain-containing protein [Oligoflexia bacterium]|nr:helix-turn-helix domain-containing protein [Oligoflexia bacterium]
MRQINKFKNENQLELNFQAVNEKALKKEKELIKLAKPAVAVKPVSVQTNKAGLSNISLSNKIDESRIKKRACRDKKPSALFFDNLISVEELAVVFRLAPQTIRNWIALGKIPYVKLGRKHVFQKGSVQEWLNQKEKSQWQ